VRRDADGQPILYLGEGLWMRATRQDGQGAVTFAGLAETGETVHLSVAIEGGAYVMVRREAAPGTRVFVTTGRCRNE
jgi:hypothetical protein